MAQNTVEGSAQLIGIFCEFWKYFLKKWGILSNLLAGSWFISSSLNTFVTESNLDTGQWQMFMFQYPIDYSEAKSIITFRYWNSEYSRSFFE